MDSFWKNFHPLIHKRSLQPLMNRKQGLMRYEVKWNTKTIFAVSYPYTIDVFITRSLHKNRGGNVITNLLYRLYYHCILTSV